MTSIPPSGTDSRSRETQNQKLQNDKPPITGSQGPVQMDYLAPSYYVDSEHPVLRAYAERLLRGMPQSRSGEAQRERAVALYFGVRDGIRYDPYAMRLDRDTFVASNVAQSEGAFCIPKAILLAATARASGIPARLGYADVRNHLCTPRLKAAMGGQDLFVYHGYVELLLDSVWVKCTPAFNKELCERFGIHPLDFNGRDDSLMHPFDREGRQHMEYVRDHGHFVDHPHERVCAAFRDTYGDLDKMLAQLNGDFAAEAGADSSPGG